MAGNAGCTCPVVMRTRGVMGSAIWESFCASAGFRRARARLRRSRSTLGLFRALEVRSSLLG